MRFLLFRLAGNKNLYRYGGVLFGGLLIGLLWIGVHQQDNRIQSLRAETYRLELMNYARLLEGHTRGVVRGLDQVVTHIKAEFEENPAEFQLQSAIERSPFLKGLSVQVGVIDRDGILRQSTAPLRTPDGRPIDLSDREHFRVHVDDDRRGLFISRPVLGRASGMWSVQLTRCINDRHGAFAGIIVVSLNPDYLTDVYGKVQLGEDSTIQVVGRDGIVRARAAGQNHTVGQSLGDLPWFAEVLRQPEGSISVIDPIDGRQRVFAFRQLAETPLVVMVGSPAETLQALHLHEHRLFMHTGWIGTAMIALGTTLLQWQILHQAAIEQRLRARERELDAARADLEHRNRDLAQFTEVLAHHLQEPVRLQHAFSQRLQKLLPEPLSDEARDALRFVMDGAIRQRALLRDVQLYLSVAQLPPASQPCNPDIALDVALGRLEDKIAGSAVTIERGELPHVLMDQGRLADVLTILVDNAIDYGRPGVAPHIRIAAERCGTEVVLSITDNGVGIPDEFHTRVFRVFERLNPKRGDPGTGIGLALAKKVVESAGGRIWVENAPDGPGTSIHFALAGSEEDA